ncbi:MAG: hypothetical protein AAF585_24225, partial [Verrucomicrobiota bacterium]
SGQSLLSFELTPQLGHAHFERAPTNIKIVHWPKFSHLEFKLPGIPGLPETNQGLDDLLDQQIPYIEMRNPRSYWVTLRKLLQADPEGYEWREENWSFPDDHFPKIYENITARQLLNEVRIYGPYDRIWTHPETPTKVHFELRGSSSNWWERFKDRTMEWLRRF